MAAFRLPALILLACMALKAQTSQADAERPVSWSLLAPNFLDDQKKIWTFPAKAATTHEWIPAIAVLGATAALVAADPYESHFFENTKTFQTFNTALASNTTEGAIVAVPVAMYIAGHFRKNSKMQRTALLSGEALLDVELLDTVLKFGVHRERPADIPPNGNYWDSWFEGKLNNASFPSGHAIAAFALATVISHQYRQRKWTPWAAYGAASLIAFSRLPLGAHYVSDVFMGAALGFSVSKFAVLRY